MRTPLLAVVLGLSLVGCVGEAPGGPGPGGDDAVDPDPGSGSDPSPTPKLDASIDRATVTTELGKDEIVTVSLLSSGSFAGNVTVTPSLVDSTGAALTNGITVTGQPMVSVAANGTATAAYTIKIPSNATGADLAATLKLDVASSAGTKQLTTSLAVTAVFTVTYAAGLGGSVATHPQRAQNIAVKKGAKIHYHNADTAVHITHGDGLFPHETTGATGGLANGTYELLTDKATVGATGNLGCHSHGSATYAKFTIE